MSLSADPEARDGELTLVFTLSAARALSEPAAAFADARRWSRYVGIVANDPSAVAAFERTHGVENDYSLRSWDKWGTIKSLHEMTDTPRHVLVGTRKQDRRIATASGWEFRSIEEAADRADWTLRDPKSVGRQQDTGRTGTEGPVTRLRRLLDDLLP